MQADAEFVGDVVTRRHSAEKITCAGDAKQRVVLAVGLSPSITTGMPRSRAPRRSEHEIGIAVIDQHRVGRARRPAVRPTRSPHPFVAIGHDGAVAARVHEDRRQRCPEPVDALTQAAVDVLARERLEHLVAVVVFARGTADRAGEPGAAAKPRDRHRRIRRAAAVDDEKSRRLHFAVGLRKFLDAEHFVEHDDAGTQDARRAGRVRGSFSG